MSTQLEFQDKVAIVTGGAMGIGEAVARLLSEKGAMIAILDIAEKEAKKIIDEINLNNKNSIFIKTDVSKSDEVKIAVEKVINKFDKIDIVSNNAGIQRYGTVESTEENDWDNILNINLKSVYNVCHYAIPHLKNSKGNIS